MIKRLFFSKKTILIFVLVALLFLIWSKVFGVAIINSSVGGTVNQIPTICCNGVYIDVDASSGSPQGTGGTYFASWYDLFFVLKYNYLPVSEAPLVGKGTRGGVCITIESKCQSTKNVDWTMYASLGDQMGFAVPANSI